jgi:biopolymer transport protein ExbD
MIAKKRDRSADIPSSSLADIAFLLLIFFLVTTTIDTDRGIDMVLPPKGEVKEINRKNIISLVINADGLVLLDKDPVEIQEIRGVIEDRQNQNPNLIVSVKTVRDTKYEVYIKVLDQLKKANAQKISIAEPES